MTEKRVWPEKVHSALKLLPDTPGVYLMHGADDAVIYVGKAVSLKNRVRQYFQSPRHQEPKVRIMVGKIERIEWIVTENEMEALVLESNLIKRYRPHYNILLKDDKHFPYVRIAVHEPYPRVEITRSIRQDGARYFGPYLAAHSIREVLDVLKKLFPLRTCKKRMPLDKAERPCLNYQIGQCLAPCAGMVGQQDYRRMIAQVCQFLSGKYDEIVAQLREEMLRASEELRFERAAVLRDRLETIEQLMQRQKAISTRGENQDIVGIAQRSSKTLVQLLYVRAGKLIGSDGMEMAQGEGETAAELLRSFLLQHYGAAPFIPPRILVPEMPAEGVLVSEFLAAQRGAQVELMVPQRGMPRRMLDMARKNAEEALLRLQAQESRQRARTIGAMEDLAKHLGLASPPGRIECYDISHTSGVDTVASMVVFTDGEPDKKQYRKFKIRSVEGIDDFASMREVILRRFTHDDGENGGRFGQMPGLVLIDGGLGQLHAARDAMREALCAHIPTAALAKKNEWLYTEEKGSEPLVLPKDGHALQLVQRVRDEAHRFAITFQRALRGKRHTHSVLEDIPGVGATRRRALLSAFRSLKAIESASLEEIAAVAGMNAPSAEAVYAFFHQGDTTLV